MTQANSNINVWSFCPFDEELLLKYSEEFHVDPIIILIILNRGITKKEDIKKFLFPDLDAFSKKFCDKNLLTAISRLIKAINNKEKVLVYGDYDVDGVTGTVLLYEALHRLGLDVDYYVPYRYTEGNGLNNGAIDKFKEQGIELIVTVDCGISNYHEVDYAKSLGIDVLITDHHTLPEKLPNAVATINPKMSDNEGDFNLAGVGVAYKLVYHLFKEYRNFDITKSKLYLDLVALGTIADVVPLIGDNRVFVKHGLKKLNKDKSLGMYYLLNNINANYVDVGTIGYGIAPRINAAGRLATATIGIELLTTKSREKAVHLARELDSLNERRKEVGSLIFSEAMELISKNPELLEKKVIVLSSADWEPGVVGIVAAQLAKKYSRPVVLISEKDGVARGSIRSFAGVNVLKHLVTCQELLINFGGHSVAAGFELEIGAVSEFKKKYIEIVDKYLEGHDLFDVIRIDFELKPQDLTIELFKKLSRLEPFGEGNREPIFLTSSLNAINYELVGKDRQHLRIQLASGFNFQINAIGFNMKQYVEILDENPTIDVLYNLSLNKYNGRESLQLKLVDLRASIK